MNTVGNIQIGKDFGSFFYSPVINGLRVMQILVLISTCRPFSSLRLYDICG